MRDARLLDLWQPVSVVFIMFLTHMLPDLLGWSLFMPWLSGCALASWIMLRPNQVGIGEVFVLGLLNDLMAGTPLGLYASAMVLVSCLLQRQQQHFKYRPFIVLWLIFALVSLAAFLWMGLVLAIAGVPFSFWVVASWGVSVLFFPLILAFLIWTMKPFKAI